MIATSEGNLQEKEPRVCASTVAFEVLSAIYGATADAALSITRRSIANFLF